MADKPRPTLADYVVTALSPALIMGLVGSLVFFLVEILYAGRYEGRLLWTLFFFVAGIVLVARISIEADPTRAAFYGLGLAAVSWMALFAFIEYPKDGPMTPYAGLINLILMAIVWWSAHRLTWDCTGIDEKRQASGRGLLAAAGFERRGETEGQAGDADLRGAAPGASATDRVSLSERWRRYRERPHTPGLTVVWFSLAALPIFGLGEALIPAGDTVRRTFSFWLAACYVGCGLGLLLTTSFLGLRRYLRQRKVPMPRAMAGVWLGLGGALVVGFVVVAALLPRPFSETPVWNLSKLTSKDRKPGRHSPLDDGTSKGGGRGTDKSNQDDRPEDNPKDNEGKAALDKEARNKSTAGAEGEDGNKSGDKSGGSRMRRGDNRGDTNDSKDEKQGNDPPNPDRLFPETKLGNVLEKLATFLKWLVFIVLALIVLAFVFRGALQYLANFVPGARRLLEALAAWWERLWRRREAKPVATAATATAPPPRRHFTSFSNPFADGTAEGRSVEELVTYSFAALEALAADRNHGRRSDETPLEFSARLANTFVSLEDGPRQIAILVVRLAYANGTLLRCPPQPRSSLGPPDRRHSGP